MEILHYIPNFTFGGIETVFINTFKKINRDKFNIHLLVESSSSESSIDYLRSIGCKVHVISKLNNSNLAKYFSQLEEIFQENNYKLVHSYSPSRTSFLFHIAKKYGVSNRIFHARSTKISDSPYKIFVIRLLLNIAKLQSTKLLANSKETGDYFFGKSSYIIIDNGLDLTNFEFDNETRRTIRGKLNLEEKFVVGHIGRFTEAKNHMLIIDIFNEALKLDPNCHLLLVGDGSLLHNVKEYVKEKKLTESVTFYGQTSKTEKLYQAMDYFLFPSNYEGLGNVAIEAQASGLKVLASTEVPSRTKITELINYMELTVPAEKWAKYIICNKNYKRTNYRKEMRDSGFDINSNIKILEKIYSNSK